MKNTFILIFLIIPRLAFGQDRAENKFVKFSEKMAQHFGIDYQKIISQVDVKYKSNVYAEFDNSQQLVDIKVFESANFGETRLDWRQ